MPYFSGLKILEPMFHFDSTSSTYWIFYWDWGWGPNASVAFPELISRYIDPIHRRILIFVEKWLRVSSTFPWNHYWNAVECIVEKFSNKNVMLLHTQIITYRRLSSGFSPIPNKHYVLYWKFNLGFGGQLTNQFSWIFQILLWMYVNLLFVRVGKNCHYF